MEKPRFVIYQLLPRLFGNTNTTNKQNGTINDNGCGKLNQISDKALLSIKELGATHVWFTGILEHATCTDYSRYGISTDSSDVVKGLAGSPYAIKDYYDIDPDLAEDIPNRMVEFEQLITRTHESGLKAIIDLVPNHVARNYVSDAAPPNVDSFGFNDNNTIEFSKNNNFYYLPGTKFSSPNKQNNKEHWIEEPAKATGNDCFSASPSITDWYETVKLNYGIDYQNLTPIDFDPVPNTWTKMLDIVLYWANKGVDGFRCDMAEMVPIDFWRWIIGEVRAKYPQMLFVAEVYDAHKYNDFIFKGGFDYLYDKVVLYDILRAVIEGKAPASDITYSWQRTEGLHHFLLYFLENHDEQRIASTFFAGSAQRGLPGMVTAALMFNNPLLIYCGQELGEKGMDNEGFSGTDGRTTIFDYWSLNSLINWNSNSNWDGRNLNSETLELRSYYSKLLNVLNEQPALCKGRFYDLMWANKDNEHFNSQHLYTFMRYSGGNTFLIIANFSARQQSYKLQLPLDLMDSAGLYADAYYTGTDVMEINKNIQFPGEVALNSGFGGKILPYSAAVYKITSSL
jgi:glycosidase